MPRVDTDFSSEDFCHDHFHGDDFRRQLHGYSLTTAEITYHMPDAQSLLQTFVWQHYDLAPDFPKLRDFLNFWRRELDGPLHSVRVAHARLIKPAEFRYVDHEITVH
ncbi:MAG: usg protein [Pseudomonadota bacterium]